MFIFLIRIPFIKIGICVCVCRILLKFRLDIILKDSFPNGRDSGTDQILVTRITDPVFNYFGNEHTVHFATMYLNWLIWIFFNQKKTVQNKIQILNLEWRKKIVSISPQPSPIRIIEFKYIQLFSFHFKSCFLSV